MRLQPDRFGRAIVWLATDVSHDLMLLIGHPVQQMVRVEWLIPNLEECTEGVRARLRRLDVHNAIGLVGVKPGDALTPDPNIGRHGHRPGVDEDRQVDVNVVTELLHARAANLLAGGCPREFDDQW